TGARCRRSSSIASMRYWLTVVAPPAIATFRSPAASRARASADSIPSVMNVNVGRYQISAFPPTRQRSYQQRQDAHHGKPSSTQHSVIATNTVWPYPVQSAFQFDQLVAQVIAGLVAQ